CRGTQRVSAPRDSRSSRSGTSPITGASSPVTRAGTWSRSHGSRDAGCDVRLTAGSASEQTLSSHLNDRPNSGQLSGLKAVIHLDSEFDITNHATRSEGGPAGLWHQPKNGRGEMLKTSLRLVLPEICGAGLAVAPALAGDGAGAPGSVGGAANETPTSWFVELSSPPAVHGTSMAKLEAEHDAFAANAAADGVKLKQHYS